MSVSYWQWGVQLLLSFELFTLQTIGMAQRFDRSPLVDIQETLLLEPEASSHRAMAGDRAARHN